MKILTVDIETTPNLAHVWKLWQENVGLAQLRESTELLCAAFKWHGDREVSFVRGMRDWDDGAGLQLLWEALDVADAVVTWNGDRFDIPHLHREFLEHGMGMPSPFASVDLLKTVRKRFKFPSNKLDYVAGRLLGTGKTSHTGHQLWVDCMAGDDKAWRLMERYNRQDVKLTEKLYDKLLPWIPNHPNVSLHIDGEEERRCPTCGYQRIQKRGFAYTALSAFPRYQCQKCGHWFRGTRRERGVDVR